MGNVYRATDPRLGREIAIKTLPPEFAHDSAALERFEREARFLAALNHPNIATIYGIEEHDGQRFLILELVPGETLDALVARGAVPLDRTLQIARDIASALEAAHEAGIVHRDLKPSNVKITPDGRVKLLDFGIAKNLVAPVSGDLSRAETVASDLTRGGTIIGTPAYMSPEQIVAGQADRRSDIWAFGCLIYEMLTSRRAFRGTTYIELADSVRHSTADFTVLPRNTPERLRRLLAQCLQKDPRDRLQDIAEAQAQLHGSETAERPNIIDSIVNVFRRPRRTEAVAVPAVLRLKQFTFASGVEEFPSWAPDGKSIVFSRDIGGIRKLFLKTLSGEERQLTSGDFDELQPAFFGDGRVLFVRAKEPKRHLEPADIFGYFGYGESSGDVWSVDINSGREAHIVDDAYNPTPSPDGKAIAVDTSWAGPRRIWLLDERGRNPQQVTTETSEAVSHIYPSWSPAGSRLTFQHIEKTKFNIGVVDLATRRSMTITDDAYQNINPVWSPSGRAIYFSSYRGGGMNVWRLPIHDDGAADGAAQQLTNGAGQDVQIAISPDGKRLAYATLRQNADIWRLPLRDDGTAAGAPQSIIATTREDSRGAWSPDGKQIAFNSDRTGDMNIWLHSLSDRSERQITRGAGGDFQPNWSPDAKQLVFFSSRSGHNHIWRVDVATGALAQITRGRSLDINPFFSPDGSEIVYQSDASGRLDLWLVRSDGTQQRQLTDVGVAGHFMRWLPDGFIYFRSPSHGMMRISPAGGAPKLFSKNGGAHISFSPDASRFIDVIGHKILWLYGTDGSEQQLFTFDDPDVRIDYPVWSPDGRWLLFDRFRPEGGDIWMAEGIE